MSSGFKRKSWCILSIMFLSLLLLTLTYAKTGIPSPTQEFFVNDYAGVLSAETKKYIFDTSKQYMANGGQLITLFKFVFPVIIFASIFRFKQSDFIVVSLPPA
jgi:hypothetical protein